MHDEQPQLSYELTDAEAPSADHVIGLCRLLDGCGVAAKCKVEHETWDWAHLTLGVAVVGGGIEAFHVRLCPRPERFLLLRAIRRLTWFSVGSGRVAEDAAADVFGPGRGRGFKRLLGRARWAEAVRWAGGE